MSDARREVYEAARATRSPIDALAVAYGPRELESALDFDLFADVPPVRWTHADREQTERRCTSRERSKMGPWGHNHRDDVADAERCNRRPLRSKRASRSKVR